ncbi:MAG: hypothetical protein HC860_19625 [Alkalinema sp. RU_4_3]|nr:hypothetical protein [Alkalinema sp. RU_4_3]
MKPFNATLALISSSALIVITTAIAPAQSPTEIGLEFQGERDLNRTTLNETQYTGDCPGVEAETKNARFTSSQTPTGDKRRVVVRNVTRGLGSPSPFTNREYEKGRSSEATQMEFGTEHSSKRFRVMPGENEFEYEIMERKQVIQTGRFTAVIDRNLRTIERNATWQEDQTCANSSVSNNVCADLRDRKSFKCPNGKVLKSYLLDTNEYYRSRISNPTERGFSIRVEGESYRLHSGDSIDLRRRDAFTVTYPTCVRCAEMKTTTVSAGKRVKFTSSGDDRRLNLVDDPR